MRTAKSDAPRSVSQQTKKLLTTEQVAKLFNSQPQTPRASFCRKGHWMGLTPRKLPNGRLGWSADDAERLLNGEG
ncbi:MAG: hypothetical protein E6R10_01450 [Rhodocyclaceae bacterium]|nr:MAG: hypothetical protein E6R10_01450 [Rhodocyclaceae bacterium]